MKGVSQFLSLPRKSIPLSCAYKKKKEKKKKEKNTDFKCLEAM